MSVIKTIPNVRPRDVAATAKRLAPLVPEVWPGAQVIAGKFMRRLAGRALARIADNVMPEVRQCGGYSSDVVFPCLLGLLLGVGVRVGSYVVWIYWYGAKI